MSESVVAGPPELSRRKSLALSLRDRRSMLGAILFRDPMGKYYEFFQTMPEGFIMPIQARRLREIVVRNKVRSIAEIGFNGGHSAFNFLIAHPDTHVTSFELSDNSHVQRAKKRIDARFPGRHELIMGDSRVTLLAAVAAGQSFDLIFVDGDHRPEGTLADLRNSNKLAHPDTVVVIDDINPDLPWGIGPTAAWKVAQKQGLVHQSNLYQTGDGRSFADGYFLNPGAVKEC